MLECYNILYRKFPKGTDLSCLEKLHKFHGTHKNYVKPKSSAIHAFGLVHFAGIVEYSINGKNFLFFLFIILKRLKCLFESTPIDQ